MQSVVQIIEQCKSKNRQTQKQLFEIFRPKLYAVSRRYTPSNYDLMDNHHNAFLKVFEKIHQFDAAKGSFEACSVKIVINCELDKCEKQ